MSLKDRRIKKGMTQVQAAVAVGVSLTAYRMWEYGMPPSAIHQRKLEEIFGEEKGEVDLIVTTADNCI